MKVFKPETRNFSFAHIKQKFEEQKKGKLKRDSKIVILG